MMKLTAWVGTCSILIAASARGDVAVLPAQGAPEVTAKLDLRVSQGIAERGYRKVLTPLAVRSRLRSSESESRASARLSEARDAVVYMKRAPAIAAARAALDALGPFGELYSPQLVARARGMLALALLLKPTDDEGALREFQRALVADPSYRPAADYSSSQVREHFALAQRSYQPGQVVPAGLARKLGVAQLISIAIETTKDGGQLQVMLRDDRGEAQQRLLDKAVPVGELPDRALALVSRMLKDLLGAPTARREPAVDASKAGERERPAEARRGRLWTWIAAGAAAATAVAGVGVGLAAQSDHDDWQQVKQEGKDYDRWVSLQDSGETKTLAANILLGVAGALAVTATVLFFVEPTIKSEKRSSIALTPAGVVLQRSF